MSYLPDLLDGQGHVPLKCNRNIPVALMPIKVKCPVTGAEVTRHVLINGNGRPIGKWSTREPCDGLATFGGDIVSVARSGMECHTSEQQRLVVSTQALLELAPLHPSSLVAARSGRKWQDVGDNIGNVVIPLVYPHMLPVNQPGGGLERHAGLRGEYGGSNAYGEFDTDTHTTAGEMAYAALLEPMLEKVAKYVLEPNRFRDCGNPFVAYMRAG